MMSRISSLILLVLLLAGCASNTNQATRIEAFVTVIGEFKGWSCSLTPQIMPLEVLAADLSLAKLEYGFEFWVPPGVSAPDKIDALRVPGNRFELKGYIYFTNDGGTRYLAPRFDLMAWRPLPLARQ